MLFLKKEFQTTETSEKDEVKDMASVFKKKNLVRARKKDITKR